MSRQADLFAPKRQPVLAAWGAGVDSTAMLIELVETGEPVDAVLFADVGGENPQTYAFIPIFKSWLEDRGVPVTIVRYEPKNFKSFLPYRTLEANCLVNGVLPSKAFGFGSCSQKWKATPQDKWTSNWQPAREAWTAGLKVIKLIGFDCSPADSKRYAEAEGYTKNNVKYDFRYPLREWGWKRDDCEARIAREGLPIPPKSSCFFCPATKPHELHAMPRDHLRRIVLMEARAKPRLINVDGLWRKPVKGLRGATPRPGSMTEYIRSENLLDSAEIDEIIASSPLDLVRFQEVHAETSVENRPELSTWLDQFIAAGTQQVFNTKSRPVTKTYETLSQPSAFEIIANAS